MQSNCLFCFSVFWYWINDLLGSSAKARYHIKTFWPIHFLSSLLMLIFINWTIYQQLIGICFAVPTQKDTEKGSTYFQRLHHNDNRKNLSCESIPAGKSEWMDDLLLVCESEPCVTWSRNMHAINRKHNMALSGLRCENSTIHCCKQCSSIKIY